MKAKGLGDTIEKVTTVTGIKNMVDAVSKVTKKDCGCGRRKERSNNPDLLVNKVFYNKN